MSDYGTGARRGRHEEMERLLPWYVNGTLQDGERERVDQHLRECAGCRAEIERDQGLAAALRAEGEIAPAPHPAQLRRLLDRLEEPEAAPAPRPRRRLPRLPPLLASTPAPVRWVLAAQLALAVVLLAARDWRPGPAAGADAPPTFQTLSDPAPAAAPATVRLRVLFAEDTPERELRQLVQTVGGHLVDGPTLLGVYTIELPSGPAAEPPEVVLQHLRSDPRVRFAELAAGSEVP